MPTEITLPCPKASQDCVAGGRFAESAVVPGPGVRRRRITRRCPAPIRDSEPLPRRAPPRKLGCRHAMADRRDGRWAVPWAGIALIAGGSFLATRREETCIPDVVIAGISIPGTCGLDKRWSKRTGAVGLGMSYVKQRRAQQGVRHEANSTRRARQGSDAVA